MNNKIENKNNLKKVAVGTVALIGLCSLTFSIITQVATASAVNKIKIIPTTYTSSTVKVKNFTASNEESQENYDIIKEFYHITIFKMLKKIII